MKRIVAIFICICMVCTVFGTAGAVSGFESEPVPMFEENAICISLTVTGHEGSSVLKTQTYNSFHKGDSVLKVLQTVLDENGISYTLKGDYVSEIGGLKEFDHGKYSGWMYAVNGQYPHLTMRQYALSGGENILVEYVERFVPTDKTDISLSVISGIANRVYTGKALTQNITVTCQGEKLVQNKDYTVSFDAHAKPGTVKVIIKGIGQYKGLVTKTFKVLPVKPAVKAATLTCSAVKLAWKAVPCAAYYRVYEYNTKTKKYTRLATTKNTYALIKNQAAGSVHYYMVKACALGGDGAEYCNAFTVKDTVKVVYLCKAPAVKAAASGKTVTLKWAKCAGAKFYRVYEWNAKTKQYTARANTAAVSLKLTKCTKGALLFAQSL